MSLLEMQSVTFCYEDGAVALRDVSLSVEQREIVLVMGARRSGRSTLLSLAAGLMTPSQGTVSFDGMQKFRQRRGREGGVALAFDRWRPIWGERAIEQVASPISSRLPPRRATAAADQALARVGARELAEERAATLGDADRIRVSIARAIVTRPRLLLLDEPLAGLRAGAVDELLWLLHSLVNDDGMSILLTAIVADGFAGARELTLQGGVLRGNTVPEPASVVQLRRSRK